MNNFCDLCIFVVVIVVVRLCYHLVPFCYHCEINLSWIERAQTTSTTSIAESNTRRVLTSISGGIGWWFPSYTFLEPISEGSHNFLLKSHHVVFLQLSLGNNMGHNHMSHLWFLLSLTPCGWFTSPGVLSFLVTALISPSSWSLPLYSSSSSHSWPIAMVFSLSWFQSWSTPVHKNNSSKCCTDQVLQSILLFSSSSH